MHKKLEEFSHILEKDLKSELEKIVNAGTINPTEVKNVTDAVCLMLKVKEYEQWLEDEEMDAQYSNRGYSMDRDMSYRRGRDASTGQYVSRDYGRSYARMPHGHFSYDSGYSSHSINDRMIDSLERMMDTASGDYERQEIQKAISMLGGMSR